MRLIFLNQKLSRQSALQDGGYHVPFAHPGLASALDMQGYWSELHEVVSLQGSPLAGRPAPDEWADLAASRTAGRR